MPTRSRRGPWTALAFAAALLAAAPHAQVPFTEVNVGLARVDRSALAWGDVDRDGDPDLLLTGMQANGAPVTRLYRNPGGGAPGYWPVLNAGLPGLYDGAAAWGDYDRDGDLDLALVGNRGTDAAPVSVAAVYRNDGANGASGWVLTDLQLPLPAVFRGTVAWVDFDVDGDLDLLVTGHLPAQPEPIAVTRLYRQHNGTFLEHPAGLTLPSGTEVAGLRAEWGDYDRDGYPDLLLQQIGVAAFLFRNRGAFDDFRFDTVVTLGLIGGNWGDFPPPDGTLYQHAPATAVHFTDVNADRLLDLWVGSAHTVETDSTAHGAWSRGVYVNRNDGVPVPGGIRGFEWVGEPLDTPTLHFGGSAVGDLVPGDAAEVFVSGLLYVASDTAPWQLPEAWIYAHTGGGRFGTLPNALDDTYRGAVALADVDGDGRLDVLLTGQDQIGTRVARLYRNALPAANTRPAAPAPLPGSALDVDPAGRTVTFRWRPAADDQTPAGGLRYSLRVGTTPLGTDLVGDLSLPTGRRLVPGLEGTVADTTWQLVRPAGQPLPAGVYHWAVQAVDPGGEASTLATGTFIVGDDEAMAATDPEVGLRLGPHDWGDYDGDGDLDLVISGGGPARTLVYRNDGYSETTGWALTLQPAALHPIDEGAVSWGDLDGDGDLDLAVTGTQRPLGSEPVNPGTYLYRNDGGTFTPTADTLAAVHQGTLAWGDVDGDGDLDLALAGREGAAYVTYLYRNQGAEGFRVLPTGRPTASDRLPGVQDPSLAWCDLDRDGDQDLLLSGWLGMSGTTPREAVARLYRNDGLRRVGYGVDGWSFTQAAVALPGVRDGTLTCGDVNSDGRPDLLLAGDVGRWAFVSQPVSGWVWFPEHTVRLYLNETPLGDATWTFTPSAFTWPHAYLDHTRLTAALADYEGDGDLDIFTSSTFIAAHTGVFLNDGGAFSTSLGLSEVGGRVSVGDVDGDRRLDALVAGGFCCTPLGPGHLFDGVTLLLGRQGVPNTPPGAPGNPTVAFSGDSLVFAWTAAADARTPAPGLTYNLRMEPMGGGPGGAPAMADAATGYRRVVRRGNAGQRLEAAVERLPAGAYRWGVQALDHAHAGSPFATAGGDVLVPLARTEPGLPGGIRGAEAWGDYDADGDLDLALTGFRFELGQGGYEQIARVYRNDGRGARGEWRFVDVGAPLPGTQWGALDWGDFDGDGDLDLFLTGYVDNTVGNVSRIYRNDGGAFTDLGVPMRGVAQGGGRWGDYDSDGDLDVFLFGNTIAVSGTDGPHLYRNDGPDGAGGWRFTPDEAASATLLTNQTTPQVLRLTAGAAAWGDFDNDGDDDLLVTGTHLSQIPISTVFRNDGGTFTNLGLPIAQVNFGGTGATAEWGDYDADGWLDVLLYGFSAQGPFVGVFRNEGGTTFTPSGFTRAVYDGGPAWGDYDNDGDLDLAFNGRLNSRPDQPRLFVYDGGAYVEDEVAGGILREHRWNLNAGGTSFADADNDGDLDLLVTGTHQEPQPFGWTAYVGWLYDNGHAALTPNTPPTAPTGLTVTGTTTEVELHWQPATDAQTLAAGLSYAVRVGTTPGGTDVLAPMALPSGYRQVTGPGNAGAATQRVLRGLDPAVTYYWSVQAVDAGFAGSPFAAEAAFRAGLPVPVDVEDAPDLPHAVVLAQNAPNPFGAQTTIRFGLPAAARVRLQVFDLLGRRVAELLDADVAAGWHEVRLPAAGLQSGVYAYALDVGGERLLRRLCVLR